MCVNVSQVLFWYWVKFCCKLRTGWGDFLFLFSLYSKVLLCLGWLLSESFHWPLFLGNLSLIVAFSSCLYVFHTPQLLSKFILDVMLGYMQCFFQWKKVGWFWVYIVLAVDRFFVKRCLDVIVFVFIY